MVEGEGFIGERVLRWLELEGQMPRYEIRAERKWFGAVKVAASQVALVNGTAECGDEAGTTCGVWVKYRGTLPELRLKLRLMLPQLAWLEVKNS